MTQLTEWQATHIQDGELKTGTEAEIFALDKRIWKISSIVTPAPDCERRAC